MSTLTELLKPRLTNTFQTPVQALHRRVFRVDCELSYEVQSQTEFVFLVHAQDASDQHVRQECLSFEPALTHRVYEDHARGHRFIRLTADEGAFTLRYRAMVKKTVSPAVSRARETPVSELADALLPLLLPTRYCESDLLAPAAQKIFGGMRPGHQRVQAISDWIHDHIEYAPGSSDATTTARDVFVQRAGVCRDFAHLGISFCRALNIPARLVVGYAPFEAPPPDFHAVFEAWVGGRWMLFDPTQMSPVEDLVRIASGRDAKDVAFATMFGPARMVDMSPQIARVDAGATAAY
jgi:transglutaminase-like putative cysteine protease